MSRKERIAIVVEGKSREINYFRSLKQYHFSSIEIDILDLPAEQNIYMLWKQLKADDMETDLIEIIRESSQVSAEKLKNLKRDDFSEIYLLFDFDPHQDNLGADDKTDFVSVLKNMTETFDNETEAGKLYISYPMIEALRDFTEWSCLPHYRCEVPLADIPHYKNLSGDKNRYTDIRKYDLEMWEMLVAIFLMRCKCLFGQSLSCDTILTWYKKKISPGTILKQQLEIFHNKRLVFVLSALPELLLDYFGEKHWEKLADNLRNISSEGCGRGVLSS